MYWRFSSCHSKVNNKLPKLFVNPKIFSFKIGLRVMQYLSVLTRIVSPPLNWIVDRRFGQLNYLSGSNLLLAVTWMVWTFLSVATMATSTAWTHWLDEFVGIIPPAMLLNLVQFALAQVLYSAPMTGLFILYPLPVESCCGGKPFLKAVCSPPWLGMEIIAFFPLLWMELALRLVSLPVNCYGRLSCLPPYFLVLSGFQNLSAAC